ncbi:hypothetical protein Q3304_02150 [Clostridioides sp. GD02377]
MIASCYFSDEIHQAYHDYRKRGFSDGILGSFRVCDLLHVH